jgi:hypothetical protein
METIVSNYREYMGNAHFMAQLDREYSFPVNVYRENTDGTRELVRVDPA